MRKGMKKARVLEYKTKPRESGSTGGRQSTDASSVIFGKVENPAISKCIGLEMTKAMIQALTIITVVIRISLSATVLAYL